MHKGIRHKSRKNKKSLNKRRRTLKGGMGATEYVSSMYGDLAQQTANLGGRMQLMPMHQGSSPAHVVAQSGGKGKRKGKGKKSLRIPNQETSSRLAGGDPEKDDDDIAGGSGYFPLNPAEYGGQVGALSDGQKGGYITQLLERAAVPFGLMALQRYAGKRSRKNRK
jgi:hypothetical protein